MEQEIWKSALKRLTQKQIDFLEHRVDQRPFRIENLQSLMRSKLEDSRARAWKVNIGDSQVFVRDVIEKIASWLQKFMDVGTIAVSIDPGHAALPWAAVSLILEVSGRMP